MNLSQIKYVSGLSISSMRSFRSRNIIAVIAIALTSMLFTILASVVFSIVLNYEQMNFQKIGTYCHGEFKNVTAEQISELKDDNRISEYGIRRAIGFIETDAIQGEVVYSDKNACKWSYIEFEEGGLPAESSEEAAADTKLLNELGVEPELGKEFTVAFTDENGNEYSETYKLSGWWERNELLGVSMLLIPDSRIAAMPGISSDLYNMAVMLKNDGNIENSLRNILSDHDIPYSGNGENAVDIGINWGYMGESDDSIFDAGSVAAMILFVLLIFLIGYLIIYSIFRISVSNDIRHYGMLKTIGASAKQIKLIVRIQALTLSVIGTVIGLMIGYAVGLFLVPELLRLTDSDFGVISVDPLIFVISAVFSVVTVFISCIRPARLAAKASPIEALRYIESEVYSKKESHIQSEHLLFNMAWCNVWRNKSKTVITILSIALSIVLFHTAVLFVKGIDVNTYVKNKIISDFLIADSSYLHGEWDGSSSIDSDLAYELDEVKGGIDYGITYISDYHISCGLTAGDIERLFADDREMADSFLSQPTDDGKFNASVKLYGMDPMCFENINVTEGSLDKLMNGGNYIVILKDKQMNDLPSYSIGDKISLSFKGLPVIIDPKSNEVYESIENAPAGVEVIKGEVHTTEYEVAAIAELPYAMSAREFSNVSLAVSSAQLAAETKAPMGMYCMINAESKDDLTRIKDQLSLIANGRYTIEDRESAAKEYDSFRNMFMMFGMVLCVAAGLVGILNFFNTFLTNIMARKHEIAVMESIGMTKKQVIGMLVTEGIIITVGSAVITLLLCLLMSPLMGAMIEKIFWFFVYRSTFISAAIIIPVFALLGVTIPVLVYKFSMKGSSVERLRISE